MYSFALLRIIHFIVNTRKRFPATRIYLCKVDLDAAYRRCNLSSSTSFESITLFKGLLLVALRLTFGRSPCPALWGIISESITDVANTLLQNPFWDHTSIFDPASDMLDPPLPLPDSEPFHQARDMAVTLPPNDLGYVDIFIDDNIGFVLDSNDNALRMIRAIPLAIRTISQPLDASNVAPWKDIIWMKKYKAEGRLEETKKVLRWIINTGSLRISLPDDKFRDWSRDISKILSTRKSYFKTLESLIGRINYIACIFQPLRHYMGRLYQALQRAKYGFTWIAKLLPYVDPGLQIFLVQNFSHLYGTGVIIKNLTMY
jgi:hypothetical protein